MAEFLLDQLAHWKGFLILKLYRGGMEKHKTNTHSGEEEQFEGVHITCLSVGALWYACPDEVDHTDQDSAKDSDDKHR